MRKIFIVLAIAIGLSLVGGMAHALTFTMTSYNVTLNQTDPGLVLYSKPILTTPNSWDLNVGQSTGWFDLFTLGTHETWVNWDEDTAWKDISVAFSWASPTGVRHRHKLTIAKYVLEKWCNSIPHEMNYAVC